MRENRELPERNRRMKLPVPVWTGRGAIARSLLLLYFLLALSAGAQSGSYDAADIPGSSPQIDAMHREIKERQMRELRKQRYAQMVANTEELLRLTTELNAEVSASKSTRLTGDQLRTLARIEKLARNVKDGMVSPVPSETPQLSTPVITLP
jgi:hypothetical protein